MQVMQSMKDYGHEQIVYVQDKIYGTTLKIIALAKEKNVSTYQAADDYAESILNA